MERCKLLKKISIRINRIEKHYNIIEIEMKKFHPNQIGFSLCKKYKNVFKNSITYIKLKVFFF
jgi:hypothetical protein